MTPPRIRHIADFPDKLNPMLVKELRQGLRGVGFVVLFISLQALLTFILLVTAGAASYENTGHRLSRTIFFLFSFAVLVIQPLRGISALSSEIRGNTIDLLCLTRLSAWRITFGKWISLVSQSALLLTAIFPYLILRYFFGDMQLLAEVFILLSIFIISATLTAFTVGLSALRSTIVRVLLPITIALGLVILISRSFITDRFFYQDLVQAFTFSTGSSLLAFLAFIVIAFYAGWMCLNIGCSQIAPIAENRSPLKRSVSFTMILVSFVVLIWAKPDASLAVIIGIVMCIPIVIISLTEASHLVAPRAAPFVRKGFLGKLAGRFLYPGWATALLFVLLLIGLLQAVLWYFSNYGYRVGEWEKMMVPAAFAILLFPVALTRITARKQDNRFGLFVLFVFSQLLVLSIIYASEQWGKDLELIPYFCWIPMTLPALYHQTFFSAEQLHLIAWINCGVYFLIALGSSFPAWQQISQTEKQIQNANHS